MLDYMRLSEISKDFDISDIKELAHESDWGVWENFINARYDAFLRNEKDAVIMVLRAIRKNWLILAQSKIYNATADDIIDFVNDLTEEILAQRVFNFEGKIKPGESFYQHLMKLFWNKRRDKYFGKSDSKEKPDKKYFTTLNGMSPVSSGETGQPEAGLNPDSVKRRNTRKRVFHIQEVPEEYMDDAADLKTDLFDEYITKTESVEYTRRCVTLLDSILNADSVPFMLICVCYAVILPKFLIVLMEQCAVFHNGIDPALHYVWDNCYCTTYNGKKANGYPEYRYAIAFSEKYKEYMQNDKYYKSIQLPYQIEQYCFKMIVVPYLNNLAEQLMTDQKVSREYIRFIRLLRNELDTMRPDTMTVDRICLVNAKVAYHFMENDTVRMMSGKFLRLLNCGLMKRTDYDWGQDYKTALDNSYHKYGHNFNCIGDIVFTKEFSRQGSDSSVTENINQYARRTLRAIVKRSVNELPPDVREDSEKNNKALTELLDKETSKKDKKMA